MKQEPNFEQIFSSVRNAPIEFSVEDVNKILMTQSASSDNFDFFNKKMVGLIFASIILFGSLLLLLVELYNNMDTPGSKSMEVSPLESIDLNRSPGVGNSRGEKKLKELLEPPVFKQPKSNHLIFPIEKIEAPSFYQINHLPTLNSFIRVNPRSLQPIHKVGPGKPLFHSTLKFSEPFVKGTWKGELDSTNQVYIKYRFKENLTNGRTKWIFEDHLDQKTLDKVFEVKAPFYSFSRAAGQMVLTKNDRQLKGAFEFSSNLSFIKFLSDMGFRPIDITGKKVSIDGAYKLKKGQSRRYSQNLIEVLWFKFFLTDIDRAYVLYLLESGYSGEALSGLWDLADNFVPVEFLQETVPELSDFVNEDFSLSELAHWYNLGLNLEVLKALQMAGIGQLTKPQIFQLCTQPLPVKYINQLADLNLNDLSFEQLMAFNAAQTPISFVKEAIEKGYVDLSLTEYTSMYTLKIAGNDLPLLREVNTSMTNVNVVEVQQELPEFKKLVVSGNITVLLTKGTTNHLTLKGSDKMVTRVNIKVNNKVLKISPKPGFRSTYLYDVHLVAKNIEQTNVKAKAKLFAKGALDLEPNKKRKGLHPTFDPK